MKILVVENDNSVAATLTGVLAAHNYAIDLATDAQTGLDLVTAIEYDLILLDLHIPKLDGISLCRQLRSQGYSKPILLLTEKNTNVNIIAALDAGADDYVIKPYNQEALLARIQALLRWSSGNPSCTLSWGDLCLDSISGKVTCGDRLIPLTATEYSLLELFLQNPDRIFNRSAILDRLWGFDDAPTENAVTVHIKDLRKKLKLGGLNAEILETVYGMGYRLKPAPDRSISTSEANKDSLQKPRVKDISSVNRVLQKFRNSFAEQIAVLAEAKTALLAGNCQEELQQKAKHEAHQLTGSMGSFGYPEGSKLARELEHLLIKDSALKRDEICRFSQLVTALEEELTKPPIPVNIQPTPTMKTHRVLAIDDDTVLTENLQAQANSWGIRLKIAPDLPTARLRLAMATPDAILLDLSFSDREEDGLTLLRELAERSPQIPVVVFTARDSLADRVAVSRLGAKQFLHKPAAIEDIFETIARVLPQPKTSEAKILIVDDDPAILAGLSALLTPWGLEVTTLTEPQRFWEVLIATSPDLVLLDLEIPSRGEVFADHNYELTDNLNRQTLWRYIGLELCQVVRQDTHWGDLPILVVTAHTDAESLQQAFAAGADDFITKPVLGPELVTRVLSRIERVRYRKKAV
ncbi:response regulator [Aerosakkonema sp. BLCC-F183]|uniref:response regulator n=1 Tax=Aerosakkonema sp. BLCC-F183 TaxID=3342834 RepID=UPI0035B858EB